MLLAGLGAIVGLFSLGAVIMGVDAAEFEQSTGVVLQALTESDPTVASYIVRLERLIGVGYSVVGLTWAIVAFGHLRRGSRNAWYLLWAMPAVFAGASAVFFSDGARALGAYYAAATILAVTGLALSSQAKRPDPGG